MTRLMANTAPVGGGPAVVEVVAPVVVVAATVVVVASLVVVVLVSVSPVVVVASGSVEVDPEPAVVAVVDDAGEAVVVGSASDPLQAAATSSTARPRTSRFIRSPYARAGHTGEGSLQSVLRDKPVIELIGAPQDLGQVRRGVDMGPSAVRVAGVIERLNSLGFEVIDRGNIACAEMATASEGDDSARFLDAIVADSARLAEAVEAAVRAGRFPLVIGGDHSIAVGTMGGVASVEPRQGLLWIDAHADFNTPETSPSGNIHGMPVAAILGEGPEPLVDVAGVSPKALDENTVIIGLRSVDRLEAERLRESRVTFFTMHDIDLLGIAPVIEESIDVLTGNGVENVHLSFDADAIDPRHAPGTGTPVMGGFTYRESHLIMELLAEADIITSADFTEVNPILDDQNQTAEMIVELIGSLAGQRVVKPGT
jgi:arginase